MRSETSFEENDSCGGNDQKDFGRSEHTKTSYNQVGHAEIIRGGAKAHPKSFRYSFTTPYHEDRSLENLRLDFVIEL